MTHLPWSEDFITKIQDALHDDLSKLVLQSCSFEPDLSRTCCSVTWQSLRWRPWWHSCKSRPACLRSTWPITSSSRPAARRCDSWRHSGTWSSSYAQGKANTILLGIRINICPTLWRCVRRGLTVDWLTLYPGPSLHRNMYAQPVMNIFCWQKEQWMAANLNWGFLACYCPGHE